MPKTTCSASSEKERDTKRVSNFQNMPACLEDAYSAITRGHIEQAKDLIDDQAVEEVRQRLAEDPSRIDMILLLAAVLNRTGQKREAQTWYERCNQVQPNALAYSELAMISASRGHLAECVENFRKSMSVNPDNPAIWVLLATKLLQRKQLKEGMELLNRAIQKEPGNASFFSTYLFSLNYLPEMDPEMIFKVHKQWGKLHAPVSKAKTSHDNDPVADRRLRIGYISPDFREHSVIRFFEPLLEAHDRHHVEVYGYGNVGSPDRITKRLEDKFDAYRNICGVDDQTVVHMIEQDKIDILVELAGHTDGNRLLVLAHKPAPIQVTYMGYGDTTGMETVDYVLTDRRLSPPESQKFYTEQLMYMPEGSHCYRVPDIDMAVTPPPLATNGYVTFGSLTPNRRFNLPLLKLWADILKRTPNARMTLGFADGMDDGIRNHYLNEFERCGVSSERIDINGPKPYLEYLKEYGNIDILLDTFPENGGTFTCESLWMGVPVITLAGPRQISRYGMTILNSVGLEQFAATIASDYVAKAVALANDPRSLTDIRDSMRARLAQSRLCDSKRFTRALESTYREMWHRWCRKHGASVSDELSV